MEPHKEASPSRPARFVQRYDIIVPASASESARKGIQARVTATNVVNVAILSAGRVLKANELLKGIQA
jgi:hypothetical protein